MIRFGRRKLFGKKVSLLIKKLKVNFVSRFDDDPEAQQKLLADTGLAEIRLEEFADRIRDVKKLVAVRLRELLNFDTGIRERDSAAYSLGTLRELELKLMAHPPKPRDAGK